MSVMTEEILVAPIDEPQALDRGFSPYQSLIVALLALVQFTIIIDFMIMSPLGAIIMPALDISAAQFGVAVSAYAFSAGISGLLAAGFADRFDRKRLLLFFYVGFTLGTALCAVAPNYHLLLLGRIVTGLFGGVMGSIVLAIITDLFALHLRGRVMGFVQTAFAASQVLGIPVGLFLSNHWNWHICFAALVGLSIVAMAAILLAMKPVNAHLGLQQDQNAFRHLIATRPATPLFAGILGDDVAGDRRIHDDAVRQRLYCAQSRNRYRASSDDLSGLRPVQHFDGTSGRQSQRRFWQISHLCFRLRGDGGDGADLHPSRPGYVDDRDLRQRPDVRRHLFAHDPVAGADLGDSRTQPARLLQRGQFFRAAVLRRAGVGSRRGDHRPECRWFAQAFRLGGLCRGRNHTDFAGDHVFRAEIGGESDRRSNGLIAHSISWAWAKWCPGKDSNLHGREATGT
jgi:hypothetical protein